MKQTTSCLSSPRPANHPCFFSPAVTPLRLQKPRRLTIAATLSKERQTDVTLTSALPEKLLNSGRPLPQHVAVIMDGNSRWAAARGLPKAAGHAAGYWNFKELVWNTSAWGIPVLTVFAFSAENSRRPKDEVEFLWKMFEGYAIQHIEQYHKEGIRICLMGDSTKMPKTLCNAIKEAETLTRNNKGLQLVVAVGYGGQQDITQACRKIACKVQNGELQPSDITEPLLAKELGTSCIADFPCPDLIIRTSGEFRLSNFLLWQSAYAELFFTDSYWPDFKKDEYIKALHWYQLRERRFGQRAA